MSKPEWVWVTDLATGHHRAVTKAEYDAEPSSFRELQQPATDRNGKPRRPVYKQPSKGVPLTGPKANPNESKANEEAER